MSSASDRALGRGAERALLAIPLVALVAAAALGRGRLATRELHAATIATAADTADADVGHALYDPVNVNHREMGTASNKLLEYMAAGLACIVPDTPSFAALLARAAFAVPCDPASPEAIAAAVDALLAAPGMAREMGAAGERLFREELAWDRTFPALLARLEALAADCERAARSL